MANCLRFDITKVEPCQNCEIQITVLNGRDRANINCPYKLYGQIGGTLAHAFYSGSSTICGDILIQKIFSVNQTHPGQQKYNLFSVAVHELGHSLGLKHSAEKDSVMTPICKHGFSVDNKHEILGESNKVLIREMYSEPKNIVIDS